MKIQISLSSRCNLNCRFCLTQSLKRRYNFIENLDMDDEVISKVLEYDLQSLSVCSNRGEALLHPNIDNFFIKAKEKGHHLSFSTNASLKSTSWWGFLGKIFDKRDSIIVPIDGIGNKIHNLHRGSDFYKVLRNVEAFVNAGGNAIWAFVKFEHNIHQIDVAKKLAESLGISFRTMNSHTYDSVLRKPPSEKVWESQSMINEQFTENDYLPCENEVFYLNVKGILFPCCFIANIFAHEPIRKNHYEKNLVELYEKEIDFINLKNNDIKTIVENSKFFKEVLKKQSNICKQVCLKWSRNQC